MPHDLFGDVFVRPRSARSRRSSLVVLSILAHGAMLLALLVVPLLATDALPIPQRAIEFIVGRDVMPVVPDPPRLRPSAHSGGEAPTAAAAAPITAPDRISPESDLEPAPTATGSYGLPRVGDVAGIGSTDIGRFEPPPPPPLIVPVRLHSGIRPPHKIVDAAAIYPAAARAAHIQGMVIIEATIDARGNVEAARVLRPQPLLDQAALDAVRQWRFTPALLSGVPIPVIMTVTVNFMLQP